MNRYTRAVLCLVAGAGLLAAIPVQAQRYTHTKSIGVRGSFWPTSDETALIRANAGGDVSMSLSGIGGTLVFTSRAHNRLLFEASAGGGGNVEVRTSIDGSEDVDFTGLANLLFGLRFQLLSQLHESPYRPYLSSGGGPYWLARGAVTEQATMQEEVAIQYDVKPGAYLGAGLDLFVTSWLSLNFDTKYHFVDLRVAEEFSGFEFGLGLAFHWGKQRELFRVRETKIIVRDLYPAYYQFYNTYPIAFVQVKNMTGYAIEVNVEAAIKNYSERVYRSGFIRLERRETRDIPVHAILGNTFLAVSERKPAMLDIRIEARAGGRFHQSVSAPVVLHNRNAWNGDIDKLVFFVTSEDPAVLKFMRNIATQLEPDSPLTNFELARRLFDALAGAGIRYQRDPNVLFYQDDRVQFATETLDLRSGDCDDLVVLYASLLESAGINTAFVDVLNPEKQAAHLYLLFDTGLSPAHGELISSNEKRYVVRSDMRGQTSIWIPVETTLLARGFDAAWQAGALQYLREGILDGGLADGWMKVIEVQ